MGRQITTTPLKQRIRPTPLAFRFLTYLATLPKGPQVVTHKMVAEGMGLAFRSGSASRAQRLTTSLGWVEVDYSIGQYGATKTLEITPAGYAALEAHKRGDA